MTGWRVPEPHLAFDLTMEDGAVVRVRQHGDRAGPRIVLCHGNGFASDAYLPFWSLLADRYEVVLYDQRNHGRNPRHDAAHHDVPYFVDDMGRVHRGVRAKLGAKPTIGAFHSISAITAIWHALDRGWLWDALVLFDPPMVPPPGHPIHEIARDFELGLSRWALTRPHRFGDPSELAAGFAASRSLRRWVAGAHELMARAILRRDERPGAGWTLACPREGESRVYATNSALHLTPRLGEIEGPTAFIASDPEAPDARSPAFVNRAMRETFGHAYEAIPGAGHMLQIEEPAACAAALDRFVGRCGLG